VAAGIALGLTLLRGRPEQPAPPAQAGKPTVEELKLAGPALGMRATIDSDTWEASPRDARIQHIKGMFHARGLDIAPDGTVTFQARRDVTVKVTAGLAAVRLMKGDEPAQALPISQTPRPLVSNEGQRGTITLKGVTPGLDVEYVYDGEGIKENIILGEAVRSALEGVDADRLELTYRFSNLAVGSGPRLRFVDASGFDLASGDLGTATFHLGQSAIPDFTFDPAFIEDRGEKHHLSRFLDLTKEDAPEVHLSVPVSLLREASWPVTIDPTIIDDRNSLQNWSAGDSMVRDADGVLHMVYAKWYLNQDGRWRWTQLYATGERQAGGMLWEKHGPVAPVHYHSNEDSNQHYPSMCVTSTGTLHAFWREYRREASQWMVNHSYKEAGEAWVDTGPVQHNATWSGEQVCAVDRNDNVWVAYRGLGSRCTVVAQWDPAEVSEVEPLNAGQGGEVVQVVGAFTGHTPLKCDWLSSTTVLVDHNDVVIVAHNRYRGGTWLYMRDPQTEDWTQQKWFNNRDWDEYYQAWKDPNANRGTDDANHGNCDYRSNGYFYNTDFALDEVGDIHAASQYRMHNHCATSDGNDGRYKGREHGFERVVYARFDRAAGRWRDWAWPRGIDSVENNLWREVEPAIVVDDPDPENFGNRGNVHILYWAESIPRRIKYGRLPLVNGGYEYTSPGDNGWEDLDDLVHGSGASRYHVQVRGSLYPSFNRVPEDLLDIAYIEDNTSLVYVSTGQPVELVRLRTPLNHRYIRETRPTFAWNRLTTDAGDGRVTYQLEIATSPVFGDGEIIHTSPVIAANEYALPVDLESGRYYYWRVTPTNALGQGFPSDPYEVGVDTDPPQAFDLLTPENNSDPRTKTPTFTWEEAQD